RRAEAGGGAMRSIGFLETSSLAKGVEAADAMLKKAAVELLMTLGVPRGKYLVMIEGLLADVESSMQAGLEVAGSTVLDHFTIQNVHPQLPAAIKGRVAVQTGEAGGLIETKGGAPPSYPAGA